MRGIQEGYKRDTRGRRRLEIQLEERTRGEGITCVFYGMCMSPYYTLTVHAPPYNMTTPMATTPTHDGRRLVLSRLPGLFTRNPAPYDMYTHRYCRSMWVWDTNYILGKQGKTPQRLIDFALSRGVASIVLEASGLVQDNLAPKLLSFMALARTQGVDVEILLANHEWYVV